MQFWLYQPKDLLPAYCDPYYDMLATSLFYWRLPPRNGWFGVAPPAHFCEDFHRAFESARDTLPACDDTLYLCQALDRFVGDVLTKHFNGLLSKSPERLMEGRAECLHEATYWALTWYPPEVPALKVIREVQELFNTILVPVLDEISQPKTPGSTH